MVIDRPGILLLTLIAFLLAVVIRYTRRYLAGDPAQGRFIFLTCLTGACVAAVVLAQNLLWFSLAWCATSLSLHQLLEFYPQRPGAVRAARKKFLISRLGDLALVAALALAWRDFGTWDFAALFAAAQARPEAVTGISLALVLAALTKSAQFPFHSWLPDTMETPTPVSALMHAGVINAGGILVIRLSPLIGQSEAALAVLCVAGGFTALFASVVMLTQPSIKRALAYSTAAQMGFMMLECGLGAFHLALLHILAHSCYKAWAFLSSGSVVHRPVPRRPAPSLLVMAVSLALAAAATLLGQQAAGVVFQDQPFLTIVFALGLAQWMWSLRPSAGMMLVAVAVSAGAFALERSATQVVTPAHTAMAWWALPGVALFAAVAVGQARIGSLERRPWFQRFYVHARNGFYAGTLANRLTAAIWPVRIQQEEV